MWAVHFSTFVGGHFAGIWGQAVLQSIVGSLFSSYLSTVTQGLLYCFAVGILGTVVNAYTREPGYDVKRYVSGHLRT